MAGTPTFAVSGGFLGTRRRERDAPTVIAGVPVDIATTNRPGARFGPEAIRRASRMLVDGDHPTLRVDMTEGLSDIGDFEIALGDVPATLALIERQRRRLRQPVRCRRARLALSGAADPAEHGGAAPVHAVRSDLRQPRPHGWRLRAA